MRSSFLVLVDGEGIVTDIKWCQPVYYGPQVGSSLLEFLSESCARRLSQALSTASSLLEGEIISVRDCAMQDDGTALDLYVKGADHRTVVFGLPSVHGESNRMFSEIVELFVKTISDSSRQSDAFRAESSRDQFEQIQRLNGELINTRRELEKANARLKIVNDDLNNRLVKDALTGLVSRYQYRAEIESLIAQQPEANGIFTFIDLDDFKLVNDTYGHGVGDKYLVEFARRLDSIKCDSSITMRVAGDEFGWYVHNPKCTPEDAVEAMWDKLCHAALDEPIVIDGVEHELRLCAGMAVYGQDTKDIFELITYADFAMYQAKRAGKNRHAKFDINEYLAKR